MMFAGRSSKLRIRRSSKGMEAARLIRRPFTSLPFIQLEQPRLLGGEVAIQDVEIGFVVQLDGSVVKISRADGHKYVVHDEELHMHHRRLIFVDFDAGFDQLWPMALGCGADNFLIDKFPGHDDLYFY